MTDTMKNSNRRVGDMNRRGFRGRLPSAMLLLLSLPAWGKPAIPAPASLSQADEPSRADQADRTGRIELPDPTGSLALGRMVFHWTDTSSPAPNTNDAKDRRELPVYLWYPAE